MPAFCTADWEVQSETNGIQVLSRSIEGTSILDLRGIGVLNAPMWKIVSVILDAERATDWIENLEESRIMQWISPAEYLTYSHIGTPFIIKDRDFGTIVNFNFLEKEKKFSIEFKAEKTNAIPETDYIRGEITQSQFELTAISKEITKVDAEMLADPKGNVPGWVVNLFQKHWPTRTFESMTKQVIRPDFRLAPGFEEILLKAKSQCESLP